MQFLTQTVSVYRALSDHQLAEEWGYKPLVTELQRWREILCFEFKLELSPVALRIGGARSHCFAHFRPGHNDFGIRREVAFNDRALERPSWQIIGTLLHELLHAWQHDHGQPGRRNYHNVQFRTKAEKYGLIVDSRGFTRYAPESPFMELIKKHGIQVPALPGRVLLTIRGGGSKLKKWSCGCTNVRVAVSSFRARCLNCGNEFVRQ